MADITGWFFSLALLLKMKTTLPITTLLGWAGMCFVSSWQRPRGTSQHTFETKLRVRPEAAAARLLPDSGLLQYRCGPAHWIPSREDVLQALGVYAASKETGVMISATVL